MPSVSVATRSINLLTKYITWPAEPDETNVPERALLQSSRFRQFGPLSNTQKPRRERTE